MIGNIVRGALPVLKLVAKHLARSALKTGRHILSDVISGRDDLKSSARKRVAEVIGGSPKEPVSKRRKKKPRRKARKAGILGEKPEFSKHDTNYCNEDRRRVTRTHISVKGGEEETKELKKNTTWLSWTFQL